uniref:ThiF domain-containing protein n=1 Tax=Macrostomum lignano TaxID=282301 RepID=A0A1I8FDE3_9PLAT
NASLRPRGGIRIRVLVVGAGGIGCELLKNLVVSGFRRISIIDLDHRCFLFRKEHVGQSKALVAKQSVLKYGRDADITAYHDSVLEEKYGVDFFSGFDIVLIALDNRAARNHVNRLCLAANVPLVESGSAGYLGQVTVIRKGVTACYECKEQQKQKSYPACTIRKHPIRADTLRGLFGEADPDAGCRAGHEDPELSSSSSTTPAVANGSQANEQQSQKQTTRSWAEATGYDPSRLLKKLFADDIRYLLTMSVLWQRPGRRAPTPLTDEQLDGSVDGYQRDHACCHVFRLAVDQLRRRYAERSSADDYLVFDKDDQAAMDFDYYTVRSAAAQPKVLRVRAPQPQVTLRCDPSILTVGALRDRVLKAELAMVAPDVEIEGRGVILLIRPTPSSDCPTVSIFKFRSKPPPKPPQRAAPPATSGRKRRSEAVESGPLGSGEAKKARLLDEADDDDELEIVAAKIGKGASSSAVDASDFSTADLGLMPCAATFSLEQPPPFLAIVSLAKAAQITRPRLPCPECPVDASQGPPLLSGWLPHWRLSLLRLLAVVGQLDDDKSAAAAVQPQPPLGDKDEDAHRRDPKPIHSYYFVIVPLGLSCCSCSVSIGAGALCSASAAGTEPGAAGIGGVAAAGGGGIGVVGSPQVAYRPVAASGEQCVKLPHGRH